jgi:hypothetical protein
MKWRDILASASLAAWPFGVGAEPAGQAIHVKAAKAIGVTMLPALLVHADEVIE